MRKNSKLNQLRFEAKLKRCAVLGIYLTVALVALTALLRSLGSSWGDKLMSLAVIAGAAALFLGSVAFVCESVRCVAAARERGSKEFLINLIYLVAYGFAAAGLAWLLLQILNGSLDVAQVIERSKN